MLPLTPSRSSAVARSALPALSAAVLWALAAGTAVVWWLHLPSGQIPLTPVATAAAPAASAGAGVQRALGQVTVVAAAPDVQKRFVLLGVIAAPSGQGSALLAIDGQPAQAFVQGQPVAEGWWLEAVRAESVRLAPVQGAGVLELAMPARP